MKFNKALYENYHTKRIVRDIDKKIVPAKYQQLQDIEDLADAILNKFGDGTIYIEFASSKEIGKGLKTKIKAKFEGDALWLMGHNISKVQSFDNVDEFIKSMEDSVWSVNEYVDKGKVRDYLFDPDQYKYVVQQIKEFAITYPQKAKSLSYDKEHSLPGEKNTNWDMEIKFRRNRYWRGGPMKIYPCISGDMNWGRIIEPEEVEVYDTSLYSGPNKKRGLFKKKH